MQKAILEDYQSCSVQKRARKNTKTILQEHLSCSAEKTAGKNTKDSRNKTIFKIYSLAKAIALTKPMVSVKWSVWVK